MRSDPADLLALFNSISDDDRIRLLHLLESQELSVADLCDIVQLPQSTVSRHLKILSEEGWVHARRLATTNLYRTLVEELDGPAKKLWQLTREQTRDWPTLQQDLLRLKQVLRKRSTDPQTFFAGAAGEWDKLRGELYGEASSTAAMLALLPPELIVVDLGCGTGQVTEQLAPHVKQVIGIDNSPAMLKAARKRLADADNVELRRGELDALPLDAQYCDAALLILALTYVPEPQRAIGEIARILKPGGRAVVVDLLPHARDDFRRQTGQRHSGFSPATIESILTTAGFAIPQISPLVPAPNSKGPALFLATARR